MMVKLDGWVSPKSSYRMFADALLCGNNILAYLVDGAVVTPRGSVNLELVFGLPRRSC